jgi:hypothetical protein
MKKNLTRVAAVSAMAALLGAAGAYAAKHEKIMLKDPAGNQLMNGSTTAFSIKTTCFGTVGCHGNGTTEQVSGLNGGDPTAPNVAYTYDQIESHNYHTQLGMNEFRGFNPTNPDSTDAWRKGAGPKGKNWVQSPGHMGSW